MKEYAEQRRRRSYRIPNLVIAARVALAFVAIGLFSMGYPASAAAVGLIVVVLYMDALDGLVARRLGLASELGGVMDITADRIVEHVFWIYFAVAHQVGLWVPMVVMTRSFLVDAARSLALSAGRTAFGDKTMMRAPWARFLVASRSMRNAYGSAKVVSFMLLGIVLTVEQAVAQSTLVVPPGTRRALVSGTEWAVGATVLLCVVRGLPVLWESRFYLTREGGVS